MNVLYIPPIPLHRLKRFFVMAMLVACAGLSASRAQETEKDFEALITLARSQVENKEFLKAIDSAQQAILKNNADFQGHFWAALASFRQGLIGDAKKEAQESLTRAPVDKKEYVQRLVDAINGQQDYGETIKAGEQALEDGLLNKAATAFTKAWNLNPADQITGLKAAHLWAEKLSNASEAARILNNLLARPQDDTVSHDASELLLSIQPKLDNAYLNALNQGVSLLFKRNYDEALSSFTTAAEISPQKPAPHIYLARIQASHGDFQAFRSEVLAAVKCGMADSQQILCAQEVRPMLSNPQFSSLMQDIFGPQEAARIKETQELWDKLTQSVSACEQEKTNWQILSTAVGFQTNANIVKIESELNTTSGLVFDGKLLEAAQVFDKATRTYANDRQAGEAAQVKEAAKTEKYESLERELGPAQEKLSRIQKDIDFYNKLLDRSQKNPLGVVHMDWVDRVSKDEQDAQALENKIDSITQQMRRLQPSP